MHWMVFMDLVVKKPTFPSARTRRIWTIAEDSFEIGHGPQCESEPWDPWEWHGKLPPTEAVVVLRLAASCCQAVALLLNTSHSFLSGLVVKKLNSVVKLMGKRLNSKKERVIGLKRIRTFWLQCLAQWLCFSDSFWILSGPSVSKNWSVPSGVLLSPLGCSPMDDIEIYQVRMESQAAKMKGLSPN